MFYEIMDFYRILLYVLFGILPSVVWLFYYLQKDLHPEPKKMILKIFLLGCLATLPVYLFQLEALKALIQLRAFSLFAYYPAAFDLLKWFLVIAFIEEFFKFLVVKLSVFNSGHLDEPADIMIYMVVVALGFAAVENVLYLFAPLGNLSFSAIIQSVAAASFVRFVGATFLHTLCSSLLGYFLVLGISKSRPNMFFLLAGLALATAFHGLYDFSVTAAQSPFNLALPIAILLVLFVAMIHNFNSARKLKSICKI